MISPLMHGNKHTSLSIDWVLLIAVASTTNEHDNSTQLLHAYNMLSFNRHMSYIVPFVFCNNLMRLMLT